MTRSKGKVAGNWKPLKSRMGLNFLCLKHLRNRWKDLRQVYREDVFGPSLGQVWMSRSPGTKKRKKLLSYPHWQCIVRRAPYAAKYGQQAGPFHSCQGVTGWWDCTLTVACVRCMSGTFFLGFLLPVITGRLGGIAFTSNRFTLLYCRTMKSCSGWWWKSVNEWTKWDVKSDF